MMRILWADDQGGFVKTCAALLTHAGHEVQHELDGESALARLNSSPFDLALIDLAMPPGRWGGLWLLRELRQRELSIPVIVLSGEGSQMETIEAMRLGADYVTKDKLDAELLDRIHEIARRGPELLRKTIAEGESYTVEFKSTLRWNLHADKPDSDIELSALKTIAAFLNTRGGTLVIGVSDDGSILGLEADRFKNEDKFQLHFWSKVKGSLGPSSASFISASVVPVDGKKLFQVKCSRSSQPIYLRWDKEGDMFFIRTGPRTERLELRDAIRYIQDNFKESVGFSG